MIVYLLIFLAVQLFQGIFLWKGYIKAGYKGWQAFVPIWNMLILFKIIQRPCLSYCGIAVQSKNKP